LGSGALKVEAEEIWLGVVVLDEVVTGRWIVAADVLVVAFKTASSTAILSSSFRNSMQKNTHILTIQGCRKE